MDSPRKRYGAWRDCFEASWCSLLSPAKLERLPPAAGSNASSVQVAHILEFAVANPALFRLVITLDRSPSQQSKGLVDLMINADRFAPDGADVQTYSLQCWSLVHGVAMLFFDGQVPFDRDLVASVVDVQSLLGVHKACRRPDAQLP